MKFAAILLICMIIIIRLADIAWFPYILLYSKGTCVWLTYGFLHSLIFKEQIQWVSKIKKSDVLK